MGDVSQTRQNLIPGARLGRRGAHRHLGAKGSAKTGGYPRDIVIRRHVREPDNHHGDGLVRAQLQLH
jgi:hypothetical protein